MPPPSAGARVTRLASMDVIRRRRLRRLGSARRRVPSRGGAAPARGVSSRAASIVTRRALGAATPTASRRPTTAPPSGLGARDFGCQLRRARAARSRRPLVCADRGRASRAVTMRRRVATSSRAPRTSPGAEADVLDTAARVGAWRGAAASEARRRRRRRASNAIGRGARLEGPSTTTRSGRSARRGAAATQLPARVETTAPASRGDVESSSAGIETRASVRSGAAADRSPVTTFRLVLRAPQTPRRHRRSQPPKRPEGVHRTPLGAHAAASCEAASELSWRPRRHGRGVAAAPGARLAVEERRL